MEQLGQWACLSLVGWIKHWGLNPSKHHRPQCGRRVCRGWSRGCSTKTLVWLLRGPLPWWSLGSPIRHEWAYILWWCQRGSSHWHSTLPLSASSRNSDCTWRGVMHPKMVQSWLEVASSTFAPGTLRLPRLSLCRHSSLEKPLEVIW